MTTSNSTRVNRALLPACIHVVSRRDLHADQTTSAFTPREAEHIEGSSSSAPGQPRLRRATAASDMRAAAEERERPRLGHGRGGTADGVFPRHLAISRERAAERRHVSSGAFDRRRKRRRRTQRNRAELTGDEAPINAPIPAPPPNTSRPPPPIVISPLLGKALAAVTASVPPLTVVPPL